jgi:hypothetical protein
MRTASSNSVAYGYQHQCMAGNGTHIPSNWSCGAVLDRNKDVLVNGGSVMVNGNAVCRTIKTAAGAFVTVTAGNSLNVAK